MMKWLSNDEIHTCVTCVGGSMLLVESLVGRRRTRDTLHVSGRPAGATLSGRRSAGAPSRLTVRCRSACCLAVLRLPRKDVGSCSRWLHEPRSSHAGDTLWGRLCKFFRSLPEFTLASGSRFRAQRSGTPPNPCSPPRVVIPAEHLRCHRCRSMMPGRGAARCNLALLVAALSLRFLPLSCLPCGSLRCGSEPLSHFPSSTTPCSR